MQRCWQRIETIQGKGQDEYAIESYNRAQQATLYGIFQKEKVPVVIPQRKGEPLVIDEDEEPAKRDLKKFQP
ncbi:hypothetical protein Ct9H90mP29_03770 [bacterium]|nr:MAG: hypothetical protein Ct9H90mP29_03770 [bacterium]